MRGKMSEDRKKQAKMRRDGIGSRISEVSSLVGGNRVVAEMGNISESQLYRIISGESQAKVETIALIAKGANISLSWLATGEGSKTPQSADSVSDTPSSYEASDERSQKAPEYGMEPVEQISFIDVEAAIKGIIRADNTMGTFPVPKQSLDEEGVTKDDVYITPKMEGNCMLPTVAEGSRVVLIHTQTKIKDNSLYVLPIGEDLMLRRIQADPRGGYIVKCDNPSYDNIKMTSEELNNIKITGRAMSQYSKLK